jgi:hypothetical protein
MKQFEIVRKLANNEKEALLIPIAITVIHTYSNPTPFNVRLLIIVSVAYGAIYQFVDGDSDDVLIVPKHILPVSTFVVFLILIVLLIGDSAMCSSNAEVSNPVFGCDSPFYVLSSLAISLGYFSYTFVKYLRAILDWFNNAYWEA